MRPDLNAMAESVDVPQGKQTADEFVGWPTGLLLQHRGGTTPETDVITLLDGFERNGWPRQQTAKLMAKALLAPLKAEPEDGRPVTIHNHLEHAECSTVCPSPAWPHEKKFRHEFHAPHTELPRDAAL